MSLSQQSAASILDLVRTQTAAVAGFASPDQIDPQVSFEQLGFNSLAAVDLYDRLSTATGLELPLTMAFNHPTPLAVADYVFGALRGEQSVTRPVAQTTASEEPIAIVGMGCRAPGGVHSANDLWDLVHSAADAITDFPDDRGWDLERLLDSDSERQGTSHVGRGGFLHDGTLFDPGFFGIGPREALAIDPQQRLLLETAWETIEHARIDPTSLRASHTAVLAGVASIDYGAVVGPVAAELEGLLVTGTIGSVLAGRIAHTFGLEGPALTVDTACSSSLVTLHLAAQMLRHGECAMALAGGVTVMATPSVFVEFSRLRGLARDGRCKSFAATADGTIFAEGCGMMLLERLSDAHRHGHEIHALIRGSAVNQDGASNGLAAPNGGAQEQVIRQALANAGIKASEVDAVEAHGTGTMLGDPIEAEALLATYGQRPTDSDPLRLGSIKSNIGHTQAAAGVIGVIKMVMAMRHGVLPKTLHAANPTPHVDWSKGAISLLDEEVSWPTGKHPRRAGVSAFGISGTNAHLILEEADGELRTRNAGDPHTTASPGQEAPGGRARMLPWTISAKTPEALIEQAERLRSHVEAGSRDSPLEIADSLLRTRARFPHRAAIVAADRARFLAGLQTLAQGEPAPGVFQGRAQPERKIAFMFTGQGSQRAGMGKELYKCFEVFATALDEVCSSLEPHLDRPLLEVMFASSSCSQAALLEQTMFTQASLFALEVALFRLLSSWGLKPDYLLGHSIGELSAAHVAGVLSLTDASTLVAARGKLMQELPSGGAMVSVQASEQEALASLAGCESQLALAAVNGPRAVVVSGERRAAGEWAQSWTAKGRKVRRLKVSHAFHSPLMDPMLEEFESVARSLSYTPPEIPIVSNVSGSLASVEQICSPSYWVRHVRATVRFLDGVAWLGGNGVASFLEIGPDGVLSAMVRPCLATSGEAKLEPDPLIVPSLRRKRPEQETVVGALTELYVHGHNANLRAVLGDQQTHTVELPTYAFQRRRYWPTDAPAIAAGPAATSTPAPAGAHASTPAGPSPGSAQHLDVEMLVRTHTAAVLGHHDAGEVDMRRGFLELGLESLGAVQLSRHLAAATGLALSETLLRDHQTPSELAAYIEAEQERRHQAGTAGAQRSEGSATRSLGASSGDTLTSMLRHAVEHGGAPELLAQLERISEFRPSFDSAQTTAGGCKTTLLSSGTAPVQLICIPSFVGPSGPFQFARIAAALPETRRVCAVSLPGLRSGQPLPRSRQVALDTVAEAVCGRTGEKPFALLGYSSGGMLAHALAETLERRGRPPFALALLDVYEPDRDAMAGVLAAVLGKLLATGNAFAAIDDDGLVGMGGYLRLFASWTPHAIATRSMLLRADTSLASALGLAAAGSPWQLADEQVEVPGDHFSIVDGDNGSTAAALETWLERTPVAAASPGAR